MVFFRMLNADPVFWPIKDLTNAFAAKELSPVEVTNTTLERIATLDGELHSYLSVTAEQAREQAKFAEEQYLKSDEQFAPLLGVPLSIKDLFDIVGETTTLGSLAYGQEVAETDSTQVALLRAAGSVFLGKSNTAEFGQSATTDNRLGPDCGNPWDPSRTSGGSSGGAASSVGAGLASAALGSDGGGSIRIPAALCGLFGLKPTFERAPAEAAFQAMTEFVGSGPITRTVADARILLEVLLSRRFTRTPGQVTRRIAWCPSPGNHAIDPGVRLVTAAAVRLLESHGHIVEEVSLPLEGWTEAFGPLVLADEWRYRQHLLDEYKDQLTSFVRKSIEAGAAITEEEIAAALKLKKEIGGRVAGLFADYDVIVTPTTATSAFPLGTRPTEIDGKKIHPLWGPFPFTAPFNVSGSPAASVPVGLADGMPVGLQVVGAHHREDIVLDVCEEIEESIAFPATQMAMRWDQRESTSAS